MGSTNDVQEHHETSNGQPAARGTPLEGMLPVPRLARWQPLRGGIINLFHYADEQFWYEDGRLLLRGNNGTGKSRVLALQLPFLLDAELSPIRMEPDRSPSKRPEWNLLLGGKHRDRLGYTWIEFGRMGDGEPQYLTLGCGLHAVEHRGAPDAWFFLTPLRVTRDFDLVTDSVPLTRNRLVETLGESGQVFRTQGEYKRAVDERLFRLGGRYRPLMDLLIQLRVPQLSRDFDEKRASEQLAGALSPLSSDVLAQVADAMRDLDEEREKLNELRRCHDGVQKFRDDYRRYLQTALKRRAVDLAQQHNRYDRVVRTIQDERRQLDEAGEERQRIELTIAQKRTDEATTRATLDTLKASPEMQDAQRLHEMRRFCDKLQAARAEAADHAARAEKRLTMLSGWLDEENRRFGERHELAARRIARVAEADLPSFVAEPFVAITEGLTERDDYVAALHSTLQAVARCEAGLKRLTEHQRRIHEQQNLLQRQIERQAELESQRDDAQGRLSDATNKLETLRRELAAALRSWYEASKTLRERLPPASEWNDSIDATPEGDDDGAELSDEDQLTANPLDGVRPLVQVALRSTLDALASARHRLQSLAGEQTKQIDELAAERQALADGVHQPPPAPYFRDGGVREHRRGAPFYELCEFTASVPAAEQPMWEAALEASGLLDAWVTLDGRLADEHLHDSTLLAGGPIAEAERRLSRVLEPAAQLPDGMAPDVLASLLDCIGVGRGTGGAWVDRDGRWQVGPITGSWAKDEVQHIGAAAREERRKRRIRAISAEIDTLQQQLQDTRAQIENVLQQARLAQQEADLLPDGTDFVHAVASREAIQADLIRIQQRHDEQLQQVAEARAELRRRTQDRDRDADDLQLTDWVERLDDLRSSLLSHRHELDGLRRDLGELVSARASLQQRQGEHDEAQQAVADAQRRAEQTQNEHEAEQARLRVLESNVGAKVEEILERIHREEEREEQIRQSLLNLQQELVTTTEQCGQYKAKLEESQNQLAQREAEREASIERLSQMVDLGLADEAVAGLSEAIEFPDRPWSAKRAALLARQIRTGLEKISESDNFWERQQNEILQRFGQLEQALLPAGHTPQMQTQHDLTVVSVPFHGRICLVPVLARELADEVRHRELLITDRERELFEQRLIGDIAQALHRNIRDAYDLCQGMNDEVESRPTSSGMRLRFQWKPITDGPDGLSAACKALLQRPAAMSADDRRALGRFLQDRIQDARSRDDAGTWQQHLEEALDYRRWFAFDIERETDGRWQRLTKRSHGTGSGGERAVALIIPMLAALAAYYRSAHEHAPRIIQMDEAFVGIDNAMRAKFMEMLVRFDLDFVMTSEREWGCYATLPALAIYHLSTRPGIDAVLATRWVWNGSQRELSDVHERMEQVHARGLVEASR